MVNCRGVVQIARGDFRFTLTFLSEKETTLLMIYCG